MDHIGSSSKEKLLARDEGVSSQSRKIEKTTKQEAKPIPNILPYNPTKFSTIGNSGQSDSSSLGSSSQPMGAAFLEDYQRHQVLKGNLDKVTFPRLSHVRLYFSCNPQDSPLERSVLWKQVLPSLREHCRDKYDVEFQVIDLNSGPDSGILVSLQQRESDIERCHETSLSTSFVSLLGHRYWTSSLPSVIGGDLFDILLKVGYNSKLTNRLLLEECYEKDENSIPPSFVLRLNGRALSSRVIKGSKQGGVCNDIATSLQYLLHDSATYALNSKTITQEQADIFLSSHLEKEIEKGIIGAKEQYSSNCVCYVRTINGMETDMNYGRISNYIDILPITKDITGLYVTEDMLDHVARTKLNEIRENMLPEKVISSNGQARVYKCAVTWMPQVGLQSDSHSEYIEDFSSHLQHVVIKMTAKRARQLRASKPEHEILCHSVLAKTVHGRSQSFHKSELLEAKSFFRNRESKICVFHGSKGCGKTHLMSAIAHELKNWYEENSFPTCIIRILGQTFLSSYVVLLLNSINTQLEKCFGIEQENSCMWCTDIVFQKKRLDDLLRNATEEQPILIVLDGLDQLLDVGDAQSLFLWLPMNVPDFVKILMSVDSECPIFQQMQKFSAENKANVKAKFVEIKNFTSSYCSKQLQRMLSEKNRRITSGQLVFALQSLKRDGSKKEVITPCMLNLVCAHALTWLSSKDVNKDTIGRTETNAVHQFIGNLQEKYGDNLVRITVSLITASKYGVTEQELEEILPTYTSVIEDLKLFFVDLKCVTKTNVAKFSDLIKRSLAYFLHNLLLDLTPLLLSKVLVGNLLYTWSNSIVRKAVESLYLASQEQKQSMQKILVRYYLEYTGRGKYPTNQKKPLKTAHIAVELPFHLKDLGRESEAMEVCYLNLHWLAAITKTFDVTAVLLFLEQAFRTFENNRPLLIVERSIRLAIPILQSNFNAFPGEIFSRTLPFARIFPDLKAIISQCALYKFEYPSLLPAGMHAQAPGAPLRVSFTEEAEIAADVLVFETNNMTNVIYGTRNRLKFFEMVTGDPLKEMAFNDDIKWLRLSRDKQFIVILSGISSPTLCMLNEKSSENKNVSLQGAFDIDWSNTSCEEFTIDSSISSSFVAVWVRLHGQQILLIDIKCAKIVKKFVCDHQIHSCFISSDEKYIYSVNFPQTILVYSTSSGSCLCSLAPLTLTSRGHIGNLFESFDDHLIGVYSNGFVQVWKKSQKECFTHLYELDSRFSDESNSTLSVIHSSISQDKAWLVLVKPVEIDVWNLKIWKTSCEISCRKHEVFSTAYFCNEQKFLLVTLAGFDMGIYVWDLTSSSSPACVSIVDGHTSPINDVIVPSFINKTSSVAPWAVTVAENDSINVWNFENIPIIPTLTMTGRPISKVFCAGNYTVTGDYSETVSVWRVSNADIVLQLVHPAVVTRIAVSEWSYKAVTADENNFQYVWNLRNGQNLLKMEGPKLKTLLITPNDQLVISIFQISSDPEQPPETSRVWKLDGGQVVCTFDYEIESAQVTCNNTFLVGISADSKLIAISLWTGMLTKILGRATASITLIHALSWHDHVISLDSQNFVTVWNIAEGVSLMSLDMKNTTMSNVRVCDSGAFLAMTDSKKNLKVLDVTNGKLRKIETFGTPLITRLSWDGTYLIYVSKMETQDDKSEITDVKFFLALFHLVGAGTLFTYPLEGIPTCMEVAKSGTSATVGLEEGRPVVFNIVSPDTKLNYPSDYKFKRNERMKFFPKNDCDQVWFSTEPRYEESSAPFTTAHHSHHQPQQLRSSKQENRPEKPIKMKFSMHLPRNNLKYDEKVPKPKVMRNLGNTTSKIKVFM